MLDLRRLQVLAAVVDTGSVTAAATRLGYTPSSVSQQLSVLERETGLPLIEKNGRGIRPTEAGVLLEQRHAGLALEDGELLAHRGRRVAEAGGGGGHRAGVDDGGEDLETT